MKNILDQIIAHKRLEVSERKLRTPVAELEKSAYFARATASLSGELRRTDRVGIIAEIKRKSPSKGILNPNVCVETLSAGYINAGASALSVLTDTEFFGGTSADLTVARSMHESPILRKDFVVDEYQLIEAKSIGADAILLIAAALSPGEVGTLASTARSLGLESLLEVHSEEELKSHACDEVHAIGVNSRDLRTFIVDLGIAERIISQIPKRVVAVAESGINTAEDLVRLKRLGYPGFLIGEAFMRHGHPEDACRALIEDVARLSTRGAKEEAHA
jgi:indole-3-glycerol phosphate synthase